MNIEPTRVTRVASLQTPDDIRVLLGDVKTVRRNFFSDGLNYIDRNINYLTFDETQSDIFIVDDTNKRMTTKPMDLDSSWHTNKDFKIKEYSLNNMWRMLEHIDTPFKLQALLKMDLVNFICRASPSSTYSFVVMERKGEPFYAFFIEVYDKTNVTVHLTMDDNHTGAGAILIHWLANRFKNLIMKLSPRLHVITELNLKQYSITSLPPHKVNEYEIGNPSTFDIMEIGSSLMDEKSLTLASYLNTTIFIITDSIKPVVINMFDTLSKVELFKNLREYDCSDTITIVTIVNGDLNSHEIITVINILVNRMYGTPFSKDIFLSNVFNPGITHTDATTIKTDAGTLIKRNILKEN